MRRSTLQSPSNVASSKRIDQLAAAFSAFRRARGPGRRIPMGLRRQYLAALDLGGSASAIGRACGVSWTQTRSWREAAGTVGAVTPEAQVLSVVDRPAPSACCSLPGGGLELRVGLWRIAINRVAE